MGRDMRSLCKTGMGAFLASCAVLLAGFGTGSSTVAEAQESGSPPGSEKLSGTLSVSWVDPRPGSGLEPGVEYSLADESGAHTKLALEESDVKVPGGPLVLGGEQVEVVGVEESGGEVRVESVRPDPGASPADEILPAGPERVASANAGDDELVRPISGSRPTATVLCRFADSTGTTPYPKTYFEGLMGGTRPGMDHYWRESSYGKANLAGSQVFGWYNLPREKAYYTSAGGRIDTFRLAEDCTAAAEAEVFFPGFSNINLMVNQAGFPSAIGNNKFSLRRDGQTRLYGITWIPQWAYEDQVVLGHEMGHSFGLPHSGGNYGDDYDSGWDVMSDGGYLSCWGSTVQYGCAGTDTIAYHKDRLGWIPPSRRYLADQGVNPTIDIERLAQPSSTGYLMAEIPINGNSSTFYTVEARRFAGYDGPVPNEASGVPGEAIVIHKVNLNDSFGDLSPVARVVDPDNNFDPNDAGAQWLPGEKFTDAANGISVEVVGQGATGFSVRITGGPPDTTPPDTEIYYARPSGTTRATFAQFLFESPTDAMADLQCSLDGAAFAPCEGPGATYFGLTTKVHTFKVRSVDRAGNVDPTPATHTWTVDLTKPTVSPISPKHRSITRDRTPTIKAAIRDTPVSLSKANLQLYVAGKQVSRFSYAGGTLTYTSPKLVPGRKVVKIVAKDTAGNATAKSWYFTIK